MGLSRPPKDDKGEISSFQVSLSIAQSLAKLIDDPKALQKAVDSAYALDDEAEKKAKNAYADIAKADAARQEALKQQEMAANIIAEANQAKASSNAVIESINKEKRRLGDKEAEQGAFALKLSNQEVDLRDREAKLVFAQAELQKQLVALALKQKELNEFDASLKEKAAQLRSIVGA